MRINIFQKIALFFGFCGFGVWLYSLLMAASLGMLIGCGVMVGIVGLYGLWSTHVVVWQRVDALRNYWAERSETHKRNIKRLRQESEFTIVEIGPHKFYRNKHGLFFNPDLMATTHFSVEGPAGHHDPVENERWFAHQQLNRGQLQGGRVQARFRQSDMAQPEMIERQPAEPIMPHILASQKCRITGVQNAGKSTLIQHIVDARLAQGHRVIVIDFHDFQPGPGNGYVGKYPPQAEVYGTGGNARAVGQFVEWLIMEIDRRYDEFSSGMVRERGHSPMYLVIDEMSELGFECPRVQKILKRKMLTKARKATIDYLEAGQTDRAEPGGTKGMNDLAKFDMDIRLEVVDNRRVATAIKGGNKNTLAEYSLPGPYHPNSGAHPVHGTGYANHADTGAYSGEYGAYSGPPYHVPDPMTPRQIDVEPAHRTILDMYARGESYSEISRAVYGNVGGKQIRQIKAILRQYGGLNDE